MTTLADHLLRHPAMVPQPPFPCRVAGEPYFLTAALERTCVLEPDRPGGDAERRTARYDQIEIVPAAVVLVPAPPQSQRLWGRTPRPTGAEGERQREKRRRESDERARRDQAERGPTVRPSVRPTGREALPNSRSDSRPSSDVEWLTEQLYAAWSRMADIAEELRLYRTTPLFLATSNPVPVELDALLDMLVRVWAQEDALSCEVVERRREARRAISLAIGYNGTVNGVTTQRRA